ncbi:WecB/TagA/CpsF family glycosyltransferase [Roseivirga thermotolerans]|uniref:WecB/TagA/CpsF family glycosyltransferase n=1 Tax=Roseivirga thermotolerans TaxID=1758176 RepID=UPI00273FB313|nr:WecB/TagA/CpsF family glycosyltransferase [Roseivirga thermotolerans]
MLEHYTKHKLFVPEYANVDYDSASDIIIYWAERRTSFGVSALAVHGLMESVKNQSLKRIINKIDLIVPDGQPVRWALNSFYKLGMKDRVYGPELTLRVLEKANEKGLRVYLFGSTGDTLDKFQSFIERRFPSVVICGVHQDRFREATDEEDKEDIKKINDSRAHIVLVGRGCPRQEFWVANHKGKVNAAMMAVGAAFDFHAGTLKQAPSWMQKNGLEWFFRLLMEPKRLAKRYFITNSQFIFTYLKFKLFYREPYRLN